MAVAENVWKKRIWERSYNKHLEKVKNVRCCISAYNQPKQNSMCISSNKLQMEEERQAKVERENYLLLNRLTNVLSRSSGSVAKGRVVEPRSLNYTRRVNEEERIMHDNINISRRLTHVKPSLDMRAVEKDFHEKHLHYQILHSKTWKQNTPKFRRKPPAKLFDDFNPNYRGMLDSGNVNAQALHNSLVGLLTVQDTILKHLVRHTRQQREKTSVAYEYMYDKKLLPELLKVTPSECHPVIIAMLTPINGPLVGSLEKAFQNMAVNQNRYVRVNRVVEIMCERTYGNSQELLDLYKARTGVSLYEDLVENIEASTSRLLWSLVSAPRIILFGPVDEEKAMTEARILSQSDVPRWDSEGGVFLNIVASGNMRQLKLTLSYFRMLKSMDVTECMREEMPEEFSGAVETLLTCIASPTTKVCRSINGHLFVTDPILVSTLVTWADIGMPLLRQEYKRLFRSDLLSILEDNYRNSPALVYIIELCNRTASHSVTKKSGSVGKVTTRAGTSVRRSAQ